MKSKIYPRKTKIPTIYLYRYLFNFISSSLNRNWRVSSDQSSGDGFILLERKEIHSDQENVCSLGTGKKKEVENFQFVFPFAAVKLPQFKETKENTSQPDLKSFIPEIHFTGTGADQRGRLQFQTKFVLEVISLKSVLYVFCTILSSIFMFSFNLMLL